MDWLKAKMAKFREKKVFTKKWQRVDKTKGEYLPLGALVKKEGGWNDKEAVEGCKLLVQKCMAMGPPWFIRNPQTGRLNYLRLSFSYEEDFVQSWAHFKEETAERIKGGGNGCGQSGPGQKGLDNQGVAKSSGQNSSKVEPPPTKKKGPNGSAGRKGDKVKDKDQEKGNAGVQEKDKGKVAKVATKLQEALRLKKTFLANVARGQEVLTCIDQDPKWDWAKNLENKG